MANDEALTDNRDLVPLSNTERRPLPGAVLLDAPARTETVNLTLMLRSRPAPGPASGPVGADRKTHHFSFDELERTLGIAPEDEKLVTSLLVRLGFTVGSVDRAFRTLQASGPVAAVSRVFGVELSHWQAGTVVYLSHTGLVYLPAELSGVVEHVLGLDTRPIFKLARPTQSPRPEEAP